MADTSKPCPKWCVIEPDPEDSGHIHRTQRTEVWQHQSGTSAQIATRGGSFGLGDQPNEIVVHAWHAAPDSDPVSGDLYVPVKDAPHLAGVVEALSHVGPEQIREVAAGIRQAAAEMESEAGA
jgi:hypothetical protein